jgi:predicted RNA-binding Zn-ribbon protein involved in translation (DUF1610 family)
MEDKKAESKKCSTCGRSVESESIWVEFPCPSCGKVKIVRCEKCKRLENPYICPSCGFRGP